MRRGGAVDRRVLLLTEIFPPDVGGSAALFGNTYSRLQGQQQPVTVIRGSGGAPGSEHREGRLRVVSMPMTGGHWGISSLASLGRYRRVITRVLSECRREPTLIHCARALPEGLAALCATGLRPSSRYLCWALGEELQYARSSRELTFLLGHVLRGAAALLAISRSTAASLESFGVPAEKVHLVHPAVDAQRFAPRPAAARAVRAAYAREDELLLLTVGRLQRRKGHDLVLEALARLAAERIPARYLIVGDGEERTRLETLAGDLGIRERVTFAGAVAAEALRDYYAAADIFVHPNRIDGFDVEGFGIVFLEAAAAGLPTIGGTNGGVPDAVDSGKTGFLVSGTDVHELVSAIRTLAASDTLRRRMGDAGQSRVQGYFTWERAASQVAEIHQRVSFAA